MNNVGRRWLQAAKSLGLQASCSRDCGHNVKGTVQKQVCCTIDLRAHAGNNHVAGCQRLLCVHSPKGVELRTGAGRQLNALFALVDDAQVVCQQHQPYSDFKLVSSA